MVRPLPLEPPVRRSPLGGPGAPAAPVVSAAAPTSFRATRARVHVAVLPSLLGRPTPRPSVSASSSPFLPGKFRLVPDPPCRVGSSPRGLLGAVAAPGSRVVARGLSCSAACGIFLDQGLNPCLSISRRFLATKSPGKPLHLVFFNVGVKCPYSKLESVKQQHKCRSTVKP